MKLLLIPIQTPSTDVTMNRQSMEVWRRTRRRTYKLMETEMMEEPGA